MRPRTALLTTVLAVLVGTAAVAVGDVVLPLGAEAPSPSPSPVPSPAPPRADDTDGAAPPGGGDEAAEDEPTPAPTREPAPVDPDLLARLETILARPDLAVDGDVGVSILDGSGRVVLERDGDRAFLPASTQKLVTAAAVLWTFGPDHRFETRVATTEPLTRNGTVVGDLVLVGSGDPALATAGYGEHVYPSRPRTPLERLADDLVAAGVRRITGGIVGDASIFGGAADARGWKPVYFSDFDARHITGLTVDAGLRYEILAPPPALDLRLHQSPDPAAEAGAALYTALTERGVTIEGGVRATDRPTAAEHVLASVQSPPLADLLRHTMRRSDNHMADTLFRTVGAVHRARGTWITAASSVRELLLDAGIDVTGFVAADGSGLSREDRVSARMLAAIDAMMTAGPHGDVWASLMAVTGGEGTLRARLRGTVAEGRFLGKTGTLDDVRSVVGAVVGPDARYHLAVVANEVTGGERFRIRVLMDELVLALAADLHDCTFVTPTPTPSPTATASLTGATEPLVSTAVCPTPSAP